MRHNALGRLLAIAGLFVLVGCGQPAATPNSTSSSTGDSNQAANATPSGSQKPAEGFFAPKPIVVAAGTPISITVDQPVSSKTSNPGDHFDASLAAPVMAGDKQLIPAGAKVVGVVTDAKSAGKFKGNAEIGVALDSITVHGETYAVKTTSVSEASKGRGQRTAVGAGGGAAVGALIGAIAGHGKGAAIGAVAGAGAGTAGAAYTGERDITIAPETKLKFKLQEPLEIKGK
jgi:hypothetical protein